MVGIIIPGTGTGTMISYYAYCTSSEPEELHSFLLIHSFNPPYCAHIGTRKIDLWVNNLHCFAIAHFTVVVPDGPFMSSSYLIGTYCNPGTLVSRMFVCRNLLLRPLSFPFLIERTNILQPSSSTPPGTVRFLLYYLKRK